MCLLCMYARVCERVCVCACTCVGEYVRGCVCKHAGVHLCPCLCCICVRMYLCGCGCARMCACRRVCGGVHVCVCAGDCKKDVCMFMQ
jgi:hypothetical protein